MQYNMVMIWAMQYKVLAYFQGASGNVGYADYWFGG